MRVIALVASASTSNMLQNSGLCAKLFKREGIESVKSEEIVCSAFSAHKTRRHASIVTDGRLNGSEALQQNRLLLLPALKQTTTKKQTVTATSA